MKQLKKIRREELKKINGGFAACRYICECNDNRTASVSDPKNCSGAGACGSERNFSGSSYGYMGNGC